LVNYGIFGFINLYYDYDFSRLIAGADSLQFLFLIKGYLPTQIPLSIFTKNILSCKESRKLTEANFQKILGMAIKEIYFLDDFKKSSKFNTMKKQFILVALGALLFLLSCKSESASPARSPTLYNLVDTVSNKQKEPEASIPASHDCAVRGKLMEDNNFWIPKEQLWICVVADDITRDSDFGDSYRIFDIYDTKNCSPVKRKVLPVNNSPDFPWYIFQNTYEEKNQVVCTSGFEFTFCYDVKNREFLPRMKPAYLLSRTALDAQSGMTQSMAVYDQYLFGHAQDLGFFAYDLKNKNQVQNFLPVAEYHLKKENQFQALFLIPAGDKKYQAIIPYFDINNGEIMFSPLLKNPISIDPAVAKNVRNNRFQIFTDLASSREGKIAFDLQQQTAVDLPADISTAPVGKVLSYLRDEKARQ